MDSNYSLIPFSLIVSGFSAGFSEVTDIDLVDTSGNPISCNYIKVFRDEGLVCHPSNLTVTGTVGYWYVKPHISYEGKSADVPATGGALDSTGVGAYLVGNCETSLELRLPKHKLCSRITIGKDSAGDGGFLVTYGFIEPASPIEKLAAKNKGK